jgi:two-component system, response regulator YesN
MYKILIVDDEPMVIHGLCRQIDWESYTLELAGTAETAENALSILKQKSIDILITDICMSKMDGLNLISAAKLLNPFIRSVIISSHSEFSYAKEALLLGVENYLLKPIDQNELNRTIEKTIDNLKRDCINAKKNEPDPSAFRWNILDRWVNVAIQDYEFYERAELLNINLSARQYQVCVIDSVNNSAEAQKLRYAQTLLEESRNFFSPIFEAECFIDRCNRVVIVLYGNELVKKHDELELIIGKIVKNTGTFACIGPVSEGVDNVPHDYSDSVEYLNYRFIDFGAGYLFYEKILQAFNMLGCGPALIQLEEALTEEDSEKMDNIIQKLLGIYSGVPMETVKKSIIPFLIMVIKRMNESGHTSEMLPSTATTKFAALHALDTKEDLSKWFLNIINQSIEVIGKRKNTLHLLVHRTLDIVNKNYNTDLSLKTIAADFKVSPAYLGQLFKEETEKYFNDYLMETRLKASRVLLLETDLKIREILCRIGMSNQSYYNRVFKKAYGVSPLSFRYQKEHGQENK